MKKLLGFCLLAVVFSFMLTSLIMTLTANTDDWHDYRWFIENEFDDSSESILGIELLQSKKIDDNTYYVLAEVTVLEEASEGFSFEVDIYKVALFFDIIEPDYFWVNAKIAFWNFFGIGERQFHYSHLNQVRIWGISYDQIPRKIYTPIPKTTF